MESAEGYWGSVEVDWREMVGKVRERVLRVSG